MNSDVMVRQLAHLKQQNVSDSSCKAIIIDTILAADSSLSETDLLTEIHSLFHVLVTKERLKGVLTTLINDHVIQINAEGIVTINPIKKNEYLIAQEEDRSIQEKAIQNWLEYLAPQCELGPELHSVLSRTLPVFLRTLFIRHGVSSYELLTTAKTDKSIDIKTISEEVSDKLGEQLKSVAAELLPTIFQIIDNKEVNTFLINCVKKAVGYISEVISDENYDMLKQALKNLTLYLDTNVLYRLLHLQGDSRFESISETLTFCKTNGVKLKVSAITQKEFSTRLGYDARVLSLYPVKADLAGVGYDYRTSDNYVSTYWAQVQKTGISVEDYNEYYRNYDVLLSAEGIEAETIIVDEDRLIEKAKDYYSKLSMRDRAYRKADATLWHDAYSLAYIQKMQRADAKNVIDTGCLFLSTDQRLMSLQREDSEFKNRPVVAIVPSQLLQMFAFTRPDEGYEETFIKFFASSSIGVSFDYSNNDIEEILFRIAHYIDKQPEIARTILSRELLNSHYKNADTDEEKEEIVYKDISDALLNELNVSKAQLVETEADREKKSKELDEVNKAIETNQVQ